MTGCESMYMFIFCFSVNIGIDEQFVLLGSGYCYHSHLMRLESSLKQIIHVYCGLLFCNKHLILLRISHKSPRIVLSATKHYISIFMAVNVYPGLWWKYDLVRMESAPVPVATVCVRRKPAGYIRLESQADGRCSGPLATCRAHFPYPLINVETDTN